jgi:hypothetical protein
VQREFLPLQRRSPQSEQKQYCTVARMKNFLGRVERSILRERRKRSGYMQRMQTAWEKRG